MTLSSCLNFYLKTFCPLFVVIACRRFWTTIFAICGNTSSRRIQSPTTHYQKNIMSHSGETETKTRFATFMEWRMKILVAATSYAPPSSKGIEFRQLCSDGSWDSYIAYRMSNKVVLI